MPTKPGDFVRRFQALGVEDACGIGTPIGCSGCKTQKRCEPLRVETPREYAGIRLTADGFDCALPVTIDSHSACSYECAYCFSEQLMGHLDTKAKPLGQTSLRKIESIFSGGGGKFGAIVRKALRYDKKDPFPCPVQLGGINDPCDSIERQQGWLKEFIRLAIKYQQPVRVSTKGTVLSDPDYLELLAEAPHLFWVTFSTNTPDDKLAMKVDAMAPPPSARIATMKALHEVGCKVALRMRPIYPGLSDATPSYPQAYRTLIEMAADAGAVAVSAEVGFVPMRFTAQQRAKWEKMERTIGVPLKDIYKQLGKSATCLRPSYAWTEQIMHAIRDVTHEHGMVLGVSDPAWKQLTDSGCCCGMLPDDPVFGNWEPENATNRLLEASRATTEEGKLIRLEDITPPWAHDMLQSQLCNMGAGPKTIWDKRHTTWADKLAEIWNEPGRERSPLHYFQGALEPVEVDGAVLYRYVGLKRQHPERTPYWDIRSTGDRPSKEKHGRQRKRRAQPKAPADKPTDGAGR